MESNHSFLSHSGSMETFNRVRPAFSGQLVHTPFNHIHWNKDKQKLKKGKLFYCIVLQCIKY